MPSGDDLFHEKREIIPFHRRKTQQTQQNYCTTTNPVAAGRPATETGRATRNTDEQCVSGTGLPPEQGKSGLKWGSRPSTSCTSQMSLLNTFNKAVSFKASYF